MSDPAPTPSAYVRPDVAAFLAYANAMPGPRMHELGAPAARAMYHAMKDVADLPIGTLAVRRDLAIDGPAGPIALRLFDVAETRVPGPVVMFFHGGGFVIGTIDTHAAFCAEVSRRLDLPVVSVEYRLAPEAPWPAAPDDCLIATRWIASSPAELGLAVTGLVTMGDSAGGTLAITTAMTLRDTPAAVPVLVQAPIYPAADMGTDYPSYTQFADGHMLTREAMDWFAAAYAPDVTVPHGSPMVGDLHGMPAAVVITASLDPIRDQGRAYAAALVRAGVAVTYREAVGNIHGFVTLRRAIPSSQGDVAGYLAAVKAAIAEAEAARVMAQAAG